LLKGLRFSLTLLFVAIAALAAACGDEEEGPSATPDQGLELAGNDGFRRFVPLLQAALDRGDVAFLSDRLKTVDVVCGLEDVPTQLGGPQCDFEGQSYAGFEVGHWRSEGGVVPVSVVTSQFETLFATVQPSASDQFGDGAVRVYALNQQDDRQDAIIAAMIERPPNYAGSGPLRIALGTRWSFEGGRWMLTGTLSAYILAEDLLIPTEEGRPYYPNWERYRAP